MMLVPLSDFGILDSNEHTYIHIQQYLEPWLSLGPATYVLILLRISTTMTTNERQIFLSCQRGETLHATLQCRAVLCRDCTTHILYMVLHASVIPPPTTSSWPPSWFMANKKTSHPETVSVFTVRLLLLPLCVPPPQEPSHSFLPETTTRPKRWLAWFPKRMRSSIRTAHNTPPGRWLSHSAFVFSCRGRTISTQTLCEAETMAVGGCLGQTRDGRYGNTYCVQEMAGLDVGRGVHACCTTTCHQCYFSQPCKDIHQRSTMAALRGRAASDALCPVRSRRTMSRSLRRLCCWRSFASQQTNLDFVSLLNRRAEVIRWYSTLYHIP